MATIPNPHAKQLAVINSKERYKVLAWGRRSGKSVLAGMYTLIKALETQGNYYIVAPTERQAKSIYWNDILQLVIPKELIAKVNNVEKTITFHHIQGDITLFDGTVVHVDHNENRPPSTISLRGVDNPEALRGVKLAGCVLDEYAFMDNAKYVFDTILQPALLDMKGWAVFISSPNGVHNPFYDLVKMAQKEGNDYFYSHATALDNPTVSDEEFEKIRKQRIEEGKLESFEQEYMAEFKSSARLVYKNFNSDLHYTKGGHMFEPNELPDEGTDVIGIDFGWIDPFAAVFIRIDYEGNWWVYDEIYKSELTPSKALPILQAKMGDRNFSRIIGDAQGKTEIANFKELRFYITPSTKGAGSIKGGISEVASLLELREVMENGKLVQRPRMRFSKAVTYTTKDMESYSHMLDAYGEPTETPEDKNNHAPDAIRYIVTDYVKARQPVQRRKKNYDPRTGRLLS